MFNKNWMHFALTGALFLGAGALRAQEPETFTTAVPPPGDVIFQSVVEDGPMARHIQVLGLGAMEENRVVKGAPFSAVAVSETTQTLADGNRIHGTTQTKLYRDSEGRTRREGTFSARAPLAASSHSPEFISIDDPVSGVRYMLHPDQKVAHQIPSTPPEMAAHLKKFGAAEGARDSGEVKKESLGTQTINGVNAEGTRSTWTIPTGQIGNDRPVVIVTERWYSPELQMVVSSKRSDPRFGETTYQLTSIQRQEPAASLFQLPPDYTVQQMGAGFHMHGSVDVAAPPRP